MDKCCHDCQNQPANKFPHLRLVAVSKFPDGTNYRCKVCSAFWVDEIDLGWRLVRETELNQPREQLGRSLSRENTVSAWNIGYASAYRN